MTVMVLNKQKKHPVCKRKGTTMAGKNISRRDFLKGMAAGTATVALGSYAGMTPFASEAVTEGASAGKYTPGTYSASAKGIHSDVTVTMTFSEDAITDVVIDASGETEGLGAKAHDVMAQAMVDAQGFDVDGIADATLTTDAVKQAAADCISQATGQEVLVVKEEANTNDWLGSAPEIAEADITETVDTEVLVVGCGTGGWIASMTAAEEGAKVLVIEKNENPTGIREDIGAIGSDLQLETIKNFPEQEISKQEALEDIVRYASGYVDYDLVKTWIDNSAELVNWLTNLMESTGDWYMEHEGGIGNTSVHARDKAYATGHSPHKTEQGITNEVTTNSTFLAHLEENGGTLRTLCAMVKLEQDENGKVTGVIAQDMNDEHYVRINASKGVIMAAGGYATNTDMMLALQPMTMEMKAAVPIGSTCNGSGIKAMLWAGGQMDPCHASMMFNRCSVLPTETAGYETTGKWFWFGEQPFLKVNLNGERFCNESGPYEFMLHSMYLQPHHTYCDIFDSNAKQYAEQFEEVGCCRLFPFDNGAEMNRDFDSTWAGMMEGENSHLEQGYLIKADNLEDLAKGLNIPVDTFVKTVEHYNELCAAGEDTDYYKETHRLTPIDAAPFYGIRTCAWHLTTLDGVRINKDMQVLREDGTAIEGLWATGDCTGGFFANNYPNLFTGLACGRTMTFGRRAAKLITQA